MSSYFFNSFLTDISTKISDLVIDVDGAKNASGTGLQVYPQKLNLTSPTPPTPQQIAAAANQIWNLVPGPIANTYFIASQLNPNLVLDIRGGLAKSGALVQIYTKKAVKTAAEIQAAKNQLWTLDMTNNIPDFLLTGIFIQSVLDSHLVLDVKGGVGKSGSALQVYTKKPMNTVAEFQAAANQLWYQVESAWTGPIQPPK